MTISHAIVFAADERDPLVSDRVGLSGYQFVGAEMKKYFISSEHVLGV